MKYFALILIFFLSSCTPLYIPPVPAKIEVEKITSLNYSTGLELQDGQLTLKLKLFSISKDGWLSVQWYDPSNTEVSSDSIWIEVSHEGETVVFVQDSKKPSQGLWRAIVSFDNKLLRQFTFEVKDE